MKKLMTAEEWHDENPLSETITLRYTDLDFYRMESYSNYKARWIIESISDAEIDESLQAKPIYLHNRFGAKWLKMQLLKRIK